MATIFFSYSHKDEALRNDLEAHLAHLKHQGLIDAWHDRRIVAGDELDAAIFGKLEAADIILLLVSSDFMSSTYCYSKEMARAMERHQAGEARVIPVILRHCDWTHSPIGKLLAVPRDGKPVASWPDRDEAFAEVAKQVRQAVEEQAKKTGRPPAVPASAAASPRPSLSAGLRALVERPSSEERLRGPETRSLWDQTPARSSNLRITQEFSDKDVDDFVKSSLEFACSFFENSLAALHERNPDVQGSVDRIDLRRFSAVLYRDGKTLAECSVRLDGLGRRNGLAFSYSADASQGSYNELFSPEAGDQSIYFTTLGLSMPGKGRDEHLSQEGAAERLWALFIQRAQS
jgi:TIR domain